MSLPHRIRKVLGGCLLSLVIIWLLGAILLTSPTICYWNERLGLPVPVSGTYKQEREENWNSFRYGDLGLEASDAQRASASKPKILIFGDSYIEADMIRPDERVQARLSEMGIYSVGIRVSGNSCVEYHHLMGIYNRIIPNVTTNVILIADISDILPPKDVADFDSMKPSYPFRKQEGKLGEISYRFRLMAFRNLLKKGRNAWKNGFDLTGNHWRKGPSIKETIDTSHYEEYWHSMLKALKSQAPNGRLLIVYAPTIPRIQDNVISFEDRDSVIFRRFEMVCEQYNLSGGGILNVGKNFCEYYRTTGRLPRGFFNTLPGEGHLNAEGHRIVAEVIAEALAK